MLSPGGIIVWNVADQSLNGSETGSSFRQALFFKDVCGLRIHDMMLFAKKNFQPRWGNRYEQEFEFAFVFAKGSPRVFSPLMVPCKNAGLVRKQKQRQRDGSHKPMASDGKPVKPTKRRGNIWTYGVGGNRDAGGHPATFPLDFARDHILSWSRPGDVVADCFLGSGTTGVAAMQTGRKFLGFEISGEYLAIARARLEHACRGAR